MHELKAKLDTWLGIKSELVQTREGRARLSYKSPSGKTLTVIGLFQSGVDGSWKVAGTEDGLSVYHWDELTSFEA